jgi:thiol-disulfide isomerase/thioredoxin
MDAGRWVLLVAVVVAVAVAVWRGLSDGRFRGTHRVRGGGAVASTGSTDGGALVSTGSTDAESVLAGTSYDAQRGERATLLQFSSAFCAPCRATRRTLADVAGTVPGVSHVEVDAEAHLDLVRTLGILRTPTTLVLDEQGREVTRASGAPNATQVLAALERSL